jgi:putative resolvase
MRLSDYAKLHNIKYRAAWNRYKAGKIPNAYKDESGHIRIKVDEATKPESTAIYCRVSSSQNKANLGKQKERLIAYCMAKGYKIDQIIMECASGLNDKRPKLIKLLQDEHVTRIVVEHSDRLTRFGLNYLTLWMESKGVALEIVNIADHDRDDLMADFVSLVTRFAARL